MNRFRSKSILLFCTLALGGCATTSLSPDPAFYHVADVVHERTGKEIEWDAGSPEDQQANAYISKLLDRQLTASSAVQIALLNNRSLQSSYAGLGMAQADLVQAGLLSNPVLDGEVLWPYSPEAAAANVVLGVVFNFIELFWRRYKEAVAESALEEVKIEIAGRVIDHAAKTNRAFTDYIAALQEIVHLKKVVRSARATVIAAKAIREAGNMTSLNFEQHQNTLTDVKLELAAIEARAAENRETLNVLMGLSGNQTRAWSAPSHLPEVGARQLYADSAVLETHAVERALELAALRQKIITLGLKYQLTDKKSLIPDMGFGVQWERNDGEKEIGPRFDVTVPLFDRGEAKRARNIMEIRQAQDQYWAMGIKVRSAARLARANLLTAAKTVKYYQLAVIPQKVRLLRATRQQYNAMQEDVFLLIRAKREEIQARQKNIAALHAYWRAHVDLQQLMSGRLPAGGGGAAMAVASAGSGGQEAGGH